MRFGYWAASLVLCLAPAGGALGSAPASAAPIVLKCHGAASVPATVVGEVCAAFGTAVAAVAPGREVVRTASAAPGAMYVFLEIKKFSRYYMSGYLVWGESSDPNDPTAHKSPVVGISSADKGLTISAYGQFARDVLRLAKLPL